MYVWSTLKLSPREYACSVTNNSWGLGFGKKHHQGKGEYWKVLPSGDQKIGRGLGKKKAIRARGTKIVIVSRVRKKPVLLPPRF